MVADIVIQDFTSVVDGEENIDGRFVDAGLNNIADWHPLIRGCAEDFVICQG